MTPNNKTEKLKENLLSEKYFITKMAVLGIILTYLTSQNFKLPFLQGIYAQTTSYLLDTTHTTTTVQQEFITTQKQTYEIIRDCTGWKSLYLYFSLIISRETQPKQIIKLFVTGTAIILTLNAVRLYTTILLSEIGLISFEIIHNWLWNTLMIIATITTWIILKKKLQPTK